MMLSQAAMREIEDIIANDVVTMHRPKDRANIEIAIRREAEAVMKAIRNQLDYDRIHRLVDSDLDKVNRHFAQKNIKKKKGRWSNLLTSKSMK